MKSKYFAGIALVKGDVSALLLVECRSDSSSDSFECCNLSMDKVAPVGVSKGTFLILSEMLKSISC